MAFAFVKVSGIGNTTSSPCSGAFTGGNTNGNVIIVAVSNYNTTVDLTTNCTDTQGNTYTKIAALSSLDGSNTDFHTWFIAPVTNGSGATNTVSVTLSSVPNRVQLYAMEYSGIKATGAFETVIAKAYSPTVMSVSINAASAGELIVTYSSKAGGTMGNLSALSGTARTSVTNVQTMVMDAASVGGSNTVTATNSNGLGGGSTSIVFKLPTTPQTFIQVFPTTNANTTTSLGPVTMTAGNFGVVAVAGNANGSLITSITDNAGNLWISTPLAPSNSQIWYCKYLVGGSTTMTLNLNGAVWPSFGNYFLEYSGVGPSATVDASTTGNGNTNSQSIGPITTTKIDLIVVGIHMHSGSIGFTPTSGYTRRGSTSTPLSFNPFDLVNVAAGSSTFTSTTGASFSWEGTMVAFGAGGGFRMLMGVGS
jgi:hypothetical protein